MGARGPLGSAQCEVAAFTVGAEAISRRERVRKP